jgi:hypothetical protein
MQRIEIKKTKGWRMPDNATFVGAGSKYENPFKVNIEMDLDESLFLYRRYLNKSIKNKTIDLTPLKGRDLACWCKRGHPCHADILMRYLEDED